MKKSPRFAFLLSPLVLSACISLPFSGGKEQPAPALYTLHDSSSGTMEVATAASGSIVVVVPPPELPPGFNSERIAIQFEQDGRLDYYADAQWSASLDELIQDVFIERAQRQLSQAIVGKPDLVPAANYRMVVKITDFGPVYRTSSDMPPRLDVGLILTVIALPEGSVKAQLTVKKSTDASENRLGPVTNELKNLLHSVLDEAVQKAAPYITEPQNIARSAD